MFESRRLDKALALVIGVVGVALAMRLWSRVWDSGFTQEDSWVLFTAPLSPFSILRSIFIPHEALWYHRPARHWLISLVELSLGPDPGVFSFFSFFFLFVGAGCLLFLAKRFSAGWAIPALVVSIYCMAGVHTKSLFWTCSIHNTMCFAFASGALLCRLQGRRVVSASLFALALLSREAALGWALPLLVADLTTSRRTGFGSWLRGSWELAALPLVYCVVVLAGFGLESSAHVIQADSGVPLARTLFAYGTVFFGWNSGEGLPHDLGLFILAPTAVFFVYWLYMGFIGVKNDRKDLVPVAACAGGVAVPMLHSVIFQPEYAVLFGIGVVLVMVIALSRVASWLRKYGDIFEPALVGLCALVAFPCYLAAGKANVRLLSESFVEEADLWKKIIEKTSKASLEAPLGVVFQLDFDGSPESMFRRRALIYLPRAFEEFIPGRYFVFEGGGLMHGIGTHDKSHPLAVRALEGAQVTRFKVTEEGDLVRSNRAN